MPPEQFTLFLDENICNCKPLLAMLDRLGVHYQRHLAHFAPGTPDQEWLAAVGKNGWILLTVDQTIRYNEIERKAVTLHRVREFVLTSGNLSGSQMADIVERAIPKMKRLCHSQPPPFIATITRAGAVNLRYGKSGPARGRPRKRAHRP